MTNTTTSTRVGPPQLCRDTQGRLCATFRSFNGQVNFVTDGRDEQALLQLAADIIAHVQPRGMA